MVKLISNADVQIIFYPRRLGGKCPTVMLNHRMRRVLKMVCWGIACGVVRILTRFLFRLMYEIVLTMSCN